MFVKDGRALVDYLLDARTAVDNAVQELLKPKKKVKIEHQQLLSENLKKFQWMVLPSEALAYIKKGFNNNNNSSSGDTPLLSPFVPVHHTQRLKAESEKSSSGSSNNNSDNSNEQESVGMFPLCSFFYVPFSPLSPSLSLSDPSHAVAYRCRHF